jgi:hypothetical protein
VKVTARCGSCRCAFRAEFRDMAQPPGRCPLCESRCATYWIDADGQPLGPPPPQPDKYQRPTKQTVQQLAARMPVHNVTRPGRKSLSQDS